MKAGASCSSVPRPISVSLDRPWPIAVPGDARIGARLLPIHRVGKPVDSLGEADSGREAFCQILSFRMTRLVLIEGQLGQ